MSTFTHDTMTNHHSWGLVKQVSDTLHIWSDRVRQRRELAQWTDRNYSPLGLRPGTTHPCGASQDKCRSQPLPSLRMR